MQKARKKAKMVYVSHELSGIVSYLSVWVEAGDYEKHANIVERGNGVALYS